MEIQRLARMLLTQYAISIKDRLFQIAELEVFIDSPHKDEGNWHFEKGVELSLCGGVSVLIKAIYSDRSGLLTGEDYVKAYIISKCLVVEGMSYTDNDRGLLLVPHVRDEPEIIYGGTSIRHFARRYRTKSGYTSYMPTVELLSLNCV